MGARLIDLPTHSDRRGNLAVIEDNLLPFKVQRRFCIWDVPWGESRGHHANKMCHQFLWAVSGGAWVNIGLDSKTFILDSPDCGLYIEPMTWLTLEFYNGAVLLVLASHPYDPEDQIRDHDEFLREKGKIE